MAPQLLEVSLEDMLSREALFSVLQPIVDLRNHQPLGHEALTRGEPGHMLQRPDLMFQAAQQFGRVTELERLCLRAASYHFSHSALTGLLFVNISPQCLEDKALEINHLTTYLKQLGLAPQQLVLEISERFPINNMDEFIHQLSRLKALGYGIAIDDLGTGYSGLKLWSQVKPDYVKIDRHFIDRIDQDTVKQAFVTSVIHLCDQLKCEIIAEGIEQPAELQLIRNLGIHLGQGFLLGKPQLQPEVLIPSNERQPAEHGHFGVLDQPVSQLCSAASCIHADTSLAEADDQFRLDQQLMSLPVLEKDRPVGLLHRRKLLEIFSLPYGRALYERKTVAHMMQQDPLIVDAAMSLEAVSKIITDDEDHYLRQHFIVTHMGRYQGVVNTKDLLKRITENQIQKARYANPLTLLPGNVPIDEEIERRLQLGRQFHLCYVDLNFFKPYNDHYGYRQGDSVLRWLAQLLQQHCSQACFIGHIGGDDFVFISETADLQQQCQQLIDAFDQGVRDYHNEQDWQAGYIRGSDRTGAQDQFPLLGISIGVVPSLLIDNGSAQHMANLAAKAKKQAKQQAGSGYYCLTADQAGDLPQTLAAVS
ncbi:GGDEF domain-containing protein [Bacterioplanoides pacificum]|uniref:GGDEF domain-containing protein n=1 Tax=Bacterioplanoides pacificum TaxID=1171596 RepID=A0ABV7VPH5_9GAMM